MSKRLNQIVVVGGVAVLGAFLMLYRGDWFDPEKIRTRNFLPAADYRPDIVQGENYYQASCARCHGGHLKGSVEGPPLLNATYAPSHHADLAFYHAVKNGVKQHHWDFGDMPMLTGLNPEQVSDIISYVRRNQQLAGIK